MKQELLEIFSRADNKDAETCLNIIKDRHINGCEDAFYIHVVLNRFLKTMDPALSALRYEIANSLSDGELERLVRFVKLNINIKSPQFPAYAEFFNGMDENVLNDVFSKVENLVILRNSFKNTKQAVSKLNMSNKIALYVQCLYTAEIKTSLGIKHSTSIKLVQNRMRHKKDIFTDGELAGLDSDYKTFFKFMELGLNQNDQAKILNAAEFPKKMLSVLLNNEDIFTKVCQANVDIWNAALSNSDVLLKKIASIQDANMYREIHRNIEKVSDTLKLDAFREEFYVEVFKNPENYSREQLESYFFDRFFGDTTANVKTNMGLILRYKDSSEIDIPERYIKLYKALSEPDFDVVLFNDLLKTKSDKLVENGQTKISALKHVQSLFYDQFLAMRENFATDVKNSIVTLQDLQESKDEELSAGAGVDVFVLNGQEFQTFVHTTYMSKDGKNDTNTNDFWKQNDKLRGQTISLSLVSDKKLQTYRDICKKLSVGFLPQDINIQQFISVNAHDVSSNTLSLFGEQLSQNTVSDFMALDEFYGKMDKSHNEFVYSRDLFDESSVIKPSFVFCADYISEIEKAFAQKMNIPIVLIDTKAYNYSFSFNESNTASKTLELYE